MSIVMTKKQRKQLEKEGWKLVSFDDVPPQWKDECKFAELAAIDGNPSLYLAPPHVARFCTYSAQQTYAAKN